jgi:hypothetical protein
MIVKSFVKEKMKKVQRFGVRGSRFKVHRFKVQRRRRPRKWPVKSKKKL